MSNRSFLASFVLAGVLLGAYGTAFAQSAPAPAPPAAQQNQNGPGGPDQQMGPDGQPDPNAPPQRPPNRMRLAIQSLTLSPDQHAKIQGMLRSFRQARQAGTPVPRRQMIAQIESVLTPQQQHRFEAQLHRPLPGGPNGPGAMNGPGGAQGGPDGDDGAQGPGAEPQGPGAAPTGPGQH